MQGHEHAASAKAIIDAHRYMTLGTADAAGAPWVSPVWYAPDDYRVFFWVSSPETRHSRNIAARPQASIVIFDSQAPAGAGNVVYMSADAQEVPDDDAARAIEIYSRRSQAQGLPVWTGDDVQAPARHRLYRAVVSEHFVLDSHDQRVPVTVRH